jgi:hypothetical protein
VEILEDFNEMDVLTDRGFLPRLSQGLLYNMLQNYCHIFSC